MQELEIAKQAARAGGDVIARYFREGVAMRSKESFNLVSDADVEAEETIAAILREAFPGHALLAEEAHEDGDAAAEHLWIVDPLDGTNNFAHGIDHFAVSIAYYRGGQAQCGVIYNPLRDLWYEAVRGQGAWRDGQAVRVCPNERLDEVLFGVGFYYERGVKMQATLAALADIFRQQVHGIRRFGTASLDLAMVGCGAFGGYFEYVLSPWDFAAGRLFVEEAGGCVTTCSGAPLPLAKTSILATNGHLHEAARRVIQPHLPPE